MKRKVTLKDIAQKAGISSAAVSIILNDKPSRISQAKKDEVKKLAKELNYVPNQLAKSLSLQQTYTIGLIVPDLSNPFFASLSKEIEKRLTPLGYFTFIMNSDEEHSQDRQIVQKMMQRQVDGILLCSSNANYHALKETFDWLEDIPVPLVLVDRVFDSTNRAFIAFNHYQGGQLVGEYIAKQISSSTRLTACLTGDLTTHTSNQRLAGFKAALHHYAPKALDPVVFSGDYSMESGYNMGQTLLQTTDVESLAGVFCFNDLIAYGFIQAIKEQGLHWQDFNIVGYDHLPFGDIFGYSFPSIAQDIPYLAKQACNLLMDTIKEGTQQQITLDVTLVHKKI